MSAVPRIVDSPQVDCLQSSRSSAKQRGNDREREQMSTSRATRQPSRPPPSASAATAEGLRDLPAVARLNLRRQQRIALGPDGGSHLFEVESGCLTCDAHLPGGRRQVLLVLYPGDALPRTSVPLLPAIGLTAVAPSAVHRYPVSAAADGFQPAVDRLAARASLHAITIGRLSGAERLATFLVEATLRLGARAPGGHTFEQPLSRAELADYLALNPDTLSRLMSRLRARGIISVPARGRMIVKQIDALSAMTPLAEALQHAYSRRLPL